MAVINRDLQNSETGIEENPTWNDRQGPRGVAQLAESFPSMPKALGSVPNTVNWQWPNTPAVTDLGQRTGS